MGKGQIYCVPSHQNVSIFSNSLSFFSCDVLLTAGSQLYLMADFFCILKKLSHIILLNQSQCDMSQMLTLLQAGIMTLHQNNIIIDNPYICCWIALVVFSVFQKKKSKLWFLNMLVITHLSEKTPNISLVSSDRMCGFRLSQFCDILSLQLPFTLPFAFLRGFSIVSVTV